MSILQEVMAEYGEIPETPQPITDKTDIRASVGSVSASSGHSEKKNPEIAPTEVLTIDEMVAIGEMRERGIVPDHYTATTTCKRCGPVPIFPGFPETVEGCPWCFNRVKGLPMPREGA